MKEKKINKKGFMNLINKGIKKGSAILGKAAVKSRHPVVSSIVDANTRRKDVDKIMDIFYPGYGSSPKFLKRRKEFNKMYKKGGPVPVIKKAKELKEKFKKDNPNYTG